MKTGLFILPEGVYHIRMRICAFVGDMYRDYSAAMIKTLQRIALEKGYKVDVFGNCSVPSMNPLHAEGLKSILSLPTLDEYDGIILCSDTLNHYGMGNDLIDTMISDDDIPPVVSVRADIAGFYNIIPDNRQIMHEVSEAVIAKAGCADIGFVTGRSDLADSLERLAGFEDAMKEAGFEVNEDLIFHGNYWLNQGPETADFFIREDGSLPKAIICSNDYMALALMDELMLRGYKIPEDVLITGIDDIDAASLHIPSLTTCRIPTERLAETCMETLERITAGEEVDFYVSVPGQLILRESTGDSVNTADLFDTYRQIEMIKKSSIDKTRGFVLLSADYEDALSFSTCLECTLGRINELKLFSCAYLCRYCENDREVMGYFKGTEFSMESKKFSRDIIIPEEYEMRDPGVRIFLPICYKNEVYGYGAFELAKEPAGFIDEKMEFIMMLFAQTLNRLNLYDKLYEVADVMDLYVRDVLTGLYNRRGFERNMNEIFFKDGKERGNRIAVASIDMDGLKAINDNLNHAAGDEAIKAVAGCIKDSLNKGEFAARMGGDEFEAVLIIDNPGRIGQFIRSFRAAIKNANAVEKRDYLISASIGTCEVTAWDELAECMNRADKAMYVEKRTKKSGRQRKS